MVYTVDKLPMKIMMLKKICHEVLDSSNRLLRAFIFRVSPSPREYQRATNTLERVYYSARYVNQVPHLRFALQAALGTREIRLPRQVDVKAVHHEDTHELTAFVRDRAFWPILVQLMLLVRRPRHYPLLPFEDQ